MDCQHAKELIDLRFSGLLDEPAELDAHLAKCARCAADYRELTRTGELLADLADDGPSAEEMDTMLNAIQTATETGCSASPDSADSPPERSVTPHGWRRTQEPGCPISSEVGDRSDKRDVRPAKTRRGFAGPAVAASIAVAACLAIAYQIGSSHYGGQVWVTDAVERPGDQPMKVRGFAKGTDTARRRGDAVRGRRGGLRADSIGDDMSERLQSLGYVGGGGGVEGDGAEQESADSLWSFGFAESASENLDARLGLMVDKDGKPVSASAEGDDGAEWLPFNSPRSFTDDGWSVSADGRRVLYFAAPEFGRDQDGDGGSVDVSTGADTAWSLGEAVMVASESQDSSFEPDDAEYDLYAERLGRATEPLVLKGQGEVRMVIGEDPALMVESDSASSPEQDTVAGDRFAEAGSGGGRNTMVLRTESVDVADLRQVLSELTSGESPRRGRRRWRVDESPSASGGASETFGYPARYADTGELTEALDEFQRSKGSDVATEAPADPVEQGASPPKLVRSKPKIIKTGELALDVPEYEPAYERVGQIVGGFRAFVADVDTSERAGGAVTGKVAIRVVPDDFEPLFDALKAVGEIVSENIKAADVSAQYVDLEARIHAGQITEQRLHELIQNKSIIDRMSAVLEVERELRRVRAEIEQMQGQLRVMADRVAQSTITVILSEPARVIPSASLSTEVPMLEEAAETLGRAVDQLGGRLTSGKVSRHDDGTFRGDYQLEVPLNRFDELLRKIESLGRVEDRQVRDRQFSDVSASWADQVRCKIALVLYEGSRELPKGEMSLEVDAVADAVERVDLVLATHESSVVSNHTQRREDGSSVATLKLAVPAGRFGELTTALGGLGRITAKQLSGDVGDIHGGMADVLCELSLTFAERQRQVPSGSMAIEVDKFEVARQRISALVSEKGVRVLASASAQRTDGTTVGRFRLGVKSADLEAVVTRLEGLGRVESRSISGIGLGDLSTVDPETVGVLDVTIGEPAAIAPPPEQGSGSIRSRLTDGLTGLYASLGLIVYGLMTMVPWLVIVGVLAWVLLRIIRRRRAKSDA